MNQPETEPARPGAVAFEVAPLGRRRGRRLDPGWIVAALIVALLLAAIAHPWQSSSPASAVVPSPGPPSRAPIPSLVAGDEPAASADSSSAPVQVVEQNQSSAPAPLADLAIDILDLAGNQGQWGVGVGASVGPPLQPALTIPALGVATDQAWSVATPSAGIVSAGCSGGPTDAPTPTPHWPWLPARSRISMARSANGAGALD